MKPFFSLSLTLALTLAVSAALGQEPNTIKKNDIETRDRKEANTKVGLSQAISDLQSNPDALFDKLDTNTDGNLSREEFGRIAAVGSQGTASTTGTTGVTGATGATGTTGGTGAGNSNVTQPAGQPATGVQPQGAQGGQQGGVKQGTQGALPTTPSGAQPAPAPGTPPN